MGDRGGYVDGADGKVRTARERCKVDVGELDDGEGAEGQRVFGISYWGDEI